jgi:hypothetical protein
MKSRIVALVLLLGLGSLSFSSQVLAADTASSANATALRSLNKLSILLDKAAMSYQMFKLDLGNPIYSQAVDKTIDRIRRLHDDYQEPVIKAKQNKALGALNKDVDTFLRELTENEHAIAKGGYEEYAVVSDMYTNKVNAQKIISNLYDDLKKKDNVKVEAAVQESRELASLLQTMASNYIEQTASVSGSALRGGSGNKPVDQLAGEFSARLAKFDIHSDTVIGLNTKVREVKNKWTFIKNSMVNFKKNTVPYLVYRYADTMVDDLLDIAELWETRNEAGIQAPAIGGPASDSTPLPPGIPPASSSTPLPPGIPPAKN